MRTTSVCRDESAVVELLDKLGAKLYSVLGHRTHKKFLQKSNPVVKSAKHPATNQATQGDPPVCEKSAVVVVQTLQLVYRPTVNKF